LAPLSGELASGCETERFKKAPSALRQRGPSFRLSKNQRLVLLHASEAVRAVDRTVLTGLEGNLASLAASCADSIEHLTLTAVVAAADAVLAGVTAGLAALGLVLKAARCVELLLTSSPNKLLTAVLAN